jgi:antimicrobial peptide system SdpB family protein
MLIQIEKRIREALGRYEPWTNVYGLARSMLALATAGTLAANPASILFRPGGGTGTPPFCSDVRAVGVFCTAPHHLDLLRWACVALLLVVASGWRPRVTGVLHWWIAFSLQANAMVVDGGDQVSSVLTLLLLPVTLTDARKWHWDPSPARNDAPSVVDDMKRLLAFFGHGLLRLQVAGIYFHAAVGKMAVPEWKDGTAMFYWGTHETFGAPAWLEALFRPIVVHGWTVAMFTWSVILLELVLSIALFMERRYQRWVLVGGMALHFGIIFVHGLPSFGTTMVAALVLYLRPWSRPWSLRPLRAWRHEPRGDVASDLSNGVPLEAG